MLKSRDAREVCNNCQTRADCLGFEKSFAFLLFKDRTLKKEVCIECRNRSTYPWNRGRFVDEKLNRRYAGTDDFYWEVNQRVHCPRYCELSEKDHLTNRLSQATPF